MRTKTCPVVIKAAGSHEGTDEGVFEALVSVFGNVDAAGDIVHKGAFADSLKSWEDSGDPIPVIWSHQHDDPDSHIGEVLEAKETDDGLWVKGRLDLDEPRAAKVYKLLKGRRVRSFSFAYDMNEYEPNDSGGFDLTKLHVFEVGPTLIPANQATELLAVKKAVASHSTDTSDAAWDGPAAERRLPNDAGAAVFRQAFAWQDPDADPDTKTAWRFIHHEVSADGQVGAANVQACVTGIGVLNGGRGGSTIPDADRQGVYDHLARHIRDAGGEPPEFTKNAPAETADEPDGPPADDPGSTGKDAPTGDPAAAEPEATGVEATKTVPDTVGEKAGRVLSSKNEQALRGALTKLNEVATQLKEVLAAVERQTPDDDEKARQARPADTEDPADAKTDEPAQAKVDEPTPVKSDVPASPSPASLRLHSDLAALQAEVSLLT